MSDSRSTMETRAAELRRAFDRTFAAALPDGRVDAVDLLAIRVGSDPYAIRLSDVAALAADRRTTVVPSSLREFLGIAGFRGLLLPVYDLRILLGYVPSAPPRWQVVAAKLPVALAFDALDGHVRLTRDAIAAEVGALRQHVAEIARTPDSRPIIRLASVLDAIERRVREAATRRES